MAEKVVILHNIYIYRLTHLPLNAVNIQAVATLFLPTHLLCVRMCTYLLWYVRFGEDMSQVSKVLGEYGVSYSLD